MSVVEVDPKGFGNVTLCAYRPASEQLKTGVSGERPAQPASQSQQRTAVEVRHVKLSYGRGKNAKPILTDINLNVPEGAM